MSLLRLCGVVLLDHVIVVVVVVRRVVRVARLNQLRIRIRIHVRIRLEVQPVNVRLLGTRM